MKIKKKAFTGAENHSATVLEAVDFLRHYQTHAPVGRNMSCFVSREAVEALIEQPDAVGLRYYYGLTHDHRKLVLLVGTGARQQDLLDGEPVKRAMFAAPLSGDGEYDSSRVDHAVTLEEAAELTATYRGQISPGQSKGGYFGKQALKSLLAQAGCVGIRFHFGAKEDGKAVVVLVGVDRQGVDLFQGVILDWSALCPPICNGLNVLNSDVSRLSDGEPALRSEPQIAEAA